MVNNKVLDKRQVEELLQKPEKELKINEAIFILQRKVRKLERRIILLETK